MAKLFFVVLVVALVAYTNAQTDAEYEAYFASAEVLMNTCAMSTCSTGHAQGLNFNNPQCESCLDRNCGRGFESAVENTIFADYGPCARVMECAMNCGTDANCMSQRCCRLRESGQCDQRVCGLVSESCANKCRGSC